MIAHFVFVIATLLDAKGPFSNNDVENPVRYIINYLSTKSYSTVS